MARQFQYGDIARRLKALLGLQGRDAWQLEESLLPMVLTADASQLPFVAEPLSGMCFDEVTGAASTPHTAISLTASGVFWLRQIVVTRLTTGWVEVNRSGQLETDGTFLDTAMLDMSTSSAGGRGSHFLPITCRGWTVAPANVGGGLAAQFKTIANTPFLLPLDVLLRRGEALYVKNTDSGTNLTVSYQGLYYPSITTP